MVPEPFADFTFRPDTGGDDASLCRRVLAQPGARERVVVMGATRVSLLVLLAQTAARVDAFDASRTQLRRARSELGAAAERIGLFAEDLRAAEVHDEPAVILVPSLTWRLLTLREGRTSFLGCMAASLRPGGRLCVDVDRVPETVPAGARFPWSHDPDRGLAIVAGGGLPAGVELSTLTPEATVEELRAAGFDLLSATDAQGGADFGPASARAWLVASPRP